MIKLLKYIPVLLAAAFTAAPAFAETGDVIGHIYSTDIIAYIGEMQVPSYNIGGKTVVIAEDMDVSEYGYAFSCRFDEEKRLLTVISKGSGKNETAIERGKVGKIVGDVLETDIKVIFNGKSINGYNIGGKTAVCLEEIGDMTDSPNEKYGYSACAAQTEWDENSKTIRLRFAGSERNLSEMTAVSRYIFTVDENVITADYSDMNPYHSRVDINGSKERYIIKPFYLKLGDTQEEIGICYRNDDGFISVSANSDYVTEKLKDYKKAHKKQYTYDEIINMFNDGENYTTQYSIETENYVFLIAKRLKNFDPDYPKECVDHIAVAKSGDFVIIADKYTEYEQVKLEKMDKDMIKLSVYPFGGPHGAVWLSTPIILNEYFDEQ